MTTITASREQTSRGRVWDGTTAMLRLHLRTGWRGLVAWPLIIAASLAGTAAGVSGLYSDLEDRQVYAATVGDSPATVIFNGPGLDLETIGGIAAFEGGFFALLLIPMIAVHLAIRFTRSQEEQGLVELVTATPIGRIAPLLSAAAAVAMALVLGGVLTWVGMTAGGVEGEGTALYSAGVVCLTLLFAGVGFVASELAQTARSAYLVGAAIISVLFVVRGVVDVATLDTDVTAGLWTTPMGWLSAIRPFGDSASALWPYAALLAGAALLTGVAVWVREQRDLGAGVLPERGGPARGTLGSVEGLAWRLLRTSAIAWVIGGVFWGSVFGLFAREVRVLTESNPELAQIVGGAATENLMAFGLILVALLSAGAAAQSVGRLGQEEMAGRAGVLLSSKTPRTRWWVTVAGLPAIVTAAAMLLGGVALGIGAWLTDGEVSSVGTAFAGALWYLPALAAVLGLSLIGVTAVGRSLPIGWVVVGWSIAVGFLADAMDMPQWARNLSVLDHVGTVPAADGSPTAAVVLTLLGAVLLGISWWRFTSRDLAAG